MLGTLREYTVRALNPEISCSLSKRESKARILLRVRKADEGIIKSEGSVKADLESLSYEPRAEISINVFYSVFHIDN